MAVPATLAPLEVFLSAANSDAAYEALAMANDGELQAVVDALQMIEGVPEVLTAQDALRQDVAGADSREAMRLAIQQFLYHFGVRRGWGQIRGSIRFVPHAEATARARGTLTPPSAQVDSDESKFREALVKGKKNFQGIDFTKISVNTLLEAVRADLNLFVGANLYGAKFAGMDLTGLSFEGALLTGANLSGATLVGVNFKSAKLILAKLEGADLKDADLSEVDLTSANLIQANLTQANLTNAILWGARLDGAKIHQTIVENANFRGATLTGTGITREIALEARAQISSSTLFDRHLPPPLPTEG